MQKKRLVTFVTALSLLVGVVSFATPQTSQASQTSVTAETADTCTYKVLSNASQINDELKSGTPSYTVKYSKSDLINDCWGYPDAHTFDLDEDSFVYMGLKRHTSSANPDDFISDILVTQGEEKEFNTYITEEDYAFGFLRKGEHRIDLRVESYGRDPATGSTDVYVFVIPVSKAINVSKKVAKNKRSATVTVKSNLGSYVDKIAIKRGNIKGNAMQSVSSDKVRAKVTKNGKYTIVVNLKGFFYEDETQYSKRTVSVSGIKKRR